MSAGNKQDSFPKFLVLQYFIENKGKENKNLDPSLTLSESETLILHPKHANASACRETNK